MTLDLFDTIIIVLLLTLMTTVIFRHLKLPIILGYLTVGIFVGHPVMGWLPVMPGVRDLAMFGVVFLLFTIGLEFSIQRLINMPRRVFCYGGLQILFSIAITSEVARWLGMPLPGAIVLGGIVALSSTAIVMKQLTEYRELKTAHGINAVAILLMQDLAAIPFIMLIPSLANAHTAGLTLPILWAIGKGIMAIFFILSLGRWVLRPLFHRISEMRSVEIFALTTLLVTLSAAWLTDILGLSPALGAFLAGMMLGETEYRGKIEAEIRPFRDILLGLFFITIGMQFNLDLLITAWPWILLLVVILIFFKIGLITLLGLVCRQGTVTSIRTGLVLAQGSEFSFAILILALQYKLIAVNYGQVILSALLLSMLLSPLVIQFNKTITKWIMRAAIPTGS